VAVLLLSGRKHFYSLAEVVKAYALVNVISIMSKAQALVKFISGIAVPYVNIQPESIFCVIDKK
jgi:hypothetical protein